MNIIDLVTVQWGIPTVSVAGVFGMMAGVLVTISKSLIATASIC